MSLLTDAFETLLFNRNQVPKRPTDTDIRHITLNSCHSSYIPGGKVPSDTIREYRPVLLARDKGLCELIEEKDDGTTELRASVVAALRPLPGSCGSMTILVTSDEKCGGNECGFSIYSLRCGPAMPLVFGRYYDADDAESSLKWMQCVATFTDMVNHGGGETWSGFDNQLLVAPPKAPWLGVAVTKALGLLEANDPSTGSFLACAEQAIAVTWREICSERRRYAHEATVGGPC